MNEDTQNPPEGRQAAREDRRAKHTLEQVSGEVGVALAQAAALLELEATALRRAVADAKGWTLVDDLVKHIGVSANALGGNYKFAHSLQLRITAEALMESSFAELDLLDNHWRGGASEFATPPREVFVILARLRRDLERLGLSKDEVQAVQELRLIDGNRGR